FFFFQAEDGIRDYKVTGVQTCALPISDVAPGYLPESFERIEAAVAPLARRGVIPLGLGGDHSITLPELRALGKVHGPLAILQFRSEERRVGKEGRVRWSRRDEREEGEE